MAGEIIDLPPALETLDRNRFPSIEDLAEKLISCAEAEFGILDLSPALLSGAETRECESGTPCRALPGEATHWIFSAGLDYEDDRVFITGDMSVVISLVRTILEASGPDFEIILKIPKYTVFLTEWDTVGDELRCGGSASSRDIAMEGMKPLLDAYEKARTAHGQMEILHHLRKAGWEKAPSIGKGSPPVQSI